MATVSAVRIGNLALSKIGARSRIESLDEQSPEAQEIKLWYDFAREEVLKAYNWSFARKRIALAAHAEDPPTDEWAYRYQYPSDCIVCRRIVNPLGRRAKPVPFHVETGVDSGARQKTILTNMANAKLLYTYDVTDTTQFSQFFIQTLATLIAHYIAYPLTGKETIQERMLKTFQGMIEGAPIHDANEEVEEPEKDASWIQARGGGVEMNDDLVR